MLKLKTEYLIYFALACAIMSSVFVLISAWISGEPSNLLKISAPASVLILCLILLRNRKKAKPDGSDFEMIKKS